MHLIGLCLVPLNAAGQGMRLSTNSQHDVFASTKRPHREGSGERYSIKECLPTRSVVRRPSQQRVDLEHFPISVNRGIPSEPRIRFCGLLQAGEAAMGYSNDLRVRVIRVVEGGVAARAAARQFVIGDATAIRWVKRWRETGSFEARSVKGQSRSPRRSSELACKC
jgi:hypothetical protein